MPRGGRVKRYPEEFKESTVQMVLKSDESIISVQNRLFSFTRNDDLLIGSEVAKASRTKQLVNALQRDKQMAEDWRLDIFCRDPKIITDMEVRSIEQGTALGPKWNYCISLVLTPASRCLGTYTLAVA